MQISWQFNNNIRGQCVINCMNQITATREKKYWKKNKNRNAIEWKLATIIDDLLASDE